MSAPTSGSKPSSKNSFGMPMRRPFTGVFSDCVYAGTGASTQVASRLSCPEITSIIRAASVTSWVNGPT